MFAGHLDIFYPPNLACLGEKGLFQHPRDLSPTHHYEQQSGGGSLQGGPAV